MKKILALILAVAMLCGVCSAFAEAANKDVIVYDDSLSFAFTYPEGYTATATVEDGILTNMIMPADATAPGFAMVIAADNALDEYNTLNEVDDETKATFAAAIAEDLNNATWEVRTTGLGTELIVIDEQDADYDMVIVACLYHGYVLAMYVGNADGSEVSAEAVDTAVQIYTDLEFVNTLAE